MNTLELDSPLNALVLQGKSGDAFLRFYDENVVSQENDEPERHGREEWMRGREALEKNITKFGEGACMSRSCARSSPARWKSFGCDAVHARERRTSQLAMAVDENFFDYYHRTSDFFTSTGLVMHLDGGTGVFGSVVTVATRTVVVK